MYLAVHTAYIEANAAAKCLWSATGVCKPGSTEVRASDRTAGPCRAVWRGAVRCGGCGAVLYVAVRCCMVGGAVQSGAVHCGAALLCCMLEVLVVLRFGLFENMDASAHMPMDVFFPHK